MKARAGKLAAGLLYSVAAFPAAGAAATDPGEQLMLERASYWRGQHRLDLAGEILQKILAANPVQPDALYQQGVLSLEQGDHGSAQQYFDRLRLLAPADERAAQLFAAVAPPPVSADVAQAKPIAAVDRGALFAVTAGDSDDLIATTTPASTPARAPAVPPAAPRRQSGVRVAALPRASGDDVDEPLPATIAAAIPAGDADIGITARAVQVAQVEIAPPPPVNGAQPLGTLKPYSPSDTLETYIDRDLARLEAQANPTLVAGLGVRAHSGSEGLQSLTEYGGSAQASFSPWYTGTATLAALPVYLDAGTPANGNLANFGANPLQAAAGFAPSKAGGQNASGVGLLGSYSWTDFSGQFGTTPLGFPVTNFVGDVAYAPKFLNGALTLRLEGLRQPVTDTVLSYAGTRAKFATVNTIAPGILGKNTTWGGVVKTGPRIAVFYDDQSFGAYGAAGVSSLTGTNVADNSAVDALLGAYFRPWKPDFGTLRVGISMFYASYDKNLGGYSFGQGGYFSPQDFEGLGFPVEFAGSAGRWSYLASTTLGLQHFNAKSSSVFPNNPTAEALLETLAPGSARTTALHSVGIGFNVKGQVEYAVDPSWGLGLAGSINNGNNYTDGILQIYLRKTFDWFAPVTFNNDPASIAARDMPASRL